MMTTLITCRRIATWMAAVLWVYAGVDVAAYLAAIIMTIGALAYAVYEDRIRETPGAD